MNRRHFLDNRVPPLGAAMVRNPMYIGVTLVLLGYAAFLAHPLALLVVVVFPAYIQAFQIAPEERALDRLFGEAYARYKEGVPRWL